MFKLSKKSKDRLQGVHPNLQKVVELAIQLSSQDFGVTEGLRTIERQRELLSKRLTQTMNSKHLKQSSGYGHAVDVAPYPLSWDLGNFYPIVEAFRKAAKQLNIKIKWGGSWDILNNTGAPAKTLVENYSKMRRSQGLRPFIDGPHFELA